jgi:hypothetical protein
MVAYSFQHQFIDPIVAGTKRQTIRRVGKRSHARPGNELQLYYAMRTKHCRLIGRVRCVLAREVRIEFSPCVNVDTTRIMLLALPGVAPEIITDRDEFARADGFESWGDMREFWALNHPDVEEFHGVLIQWEALSQ